MTAKSKTHQAYLLRFTHPDETQPWRVVVQCVGLEQRYHFASVGEAINFVLDQLEAADLAGPGPASE